MTNLSKEVTDYAALAEELRELGGGICEFGTAAYSPNNVVGLLRRAADALQATSTPKLDDAALREILAEEYKKHWPESGWDKSFRSGGGMRHAAPILAALRRVSSPTMRDDVIEECAKVAEKPLAYLKEAQGNCYKFAESSTGYVDQEHWRKMGDGWQPVINVATNTAAAIRSLKSQQS